jgi:hypothetical protein
VCVCVCVCARREEGSVIQAQMPPSGAVPLPWAGTLAPRKRADPTTRTAPGSQHKGVSWHKRRRRWQAAIRTDRKVVHLGYFVDEGRAAAVYAAASRAKAEGRPVKPPPKKNPAAIVSRHRGVCWRSDQAVWVAQISVAGVQKYLGVFSDDRRHAVPACRLSRRKVGPPPLTISVMMSARPSLR